MLMTKVSTAARDDTDNEGQGVFLVFFNLSTRTKTPSPGRASGIAHSPPIRSTQRRLLEDYYMGSKN